MNNRTHVSENRESGHFGPCPDCPHLSPPTLQLVAGSEVENSEQPCHETQRRAGNPSVVGTLEHETIQYDYKATHHAAREYLIPESSPSGANGYADLVDLDTFGIWEIKNEAKWQTGVPEVNRYVAKAKENCDPGAPWHPATGYGMKEFPAPNFPGYMMEVKEQAPGVLSYKFKRPENPGRVPIAPPFSSPERVPEFQPEPREEVPEVTLIEEVVRFIEMVIEESLDAAKAADEWMAEHTELAWPIIILGTLGLLVLIGDDLTGVGVIDDPAIPIVAALVAAAWTYAW